MFQKKDVWFYALLVVCCIIPISTQSLWLDEAWTVIDFALKPKFGDLISSLLASGGGDSQFPGYNMYMWLWVRIFGISEFAVRAANLPFFLLTLLYIIFYLPRDNRFKTSFLLLICLSPFTWYYLNESRYIISIFSFSMLALVAVVNYFEGEEADKKFTVFVLLASITLGIAFMMLYVFALIPIVFIIYYYLKQRGESLKGLILKWKLALFIFLILLALMGTYYMFTILRGAGGMRLNPGLNNIAFVLYDFIGFAGIGPPRDVLREKAQIDVSSIYFLKVVLFSIVYLGFLVLIVLNLRKSKPNKLALYGYAGMLVSMTLFFIFAKIFQFKFLSRHVVFIYPSFLLFSFTFLYDAFLRYRKVGSILLILLVTGLIYSDLNLRFNADYQKTDGLKGCIIASREAKGVRILWISDKQVFDYYVIKRGKVKDLDPKNVEFVYKKTDVDIVKYIAKPLSKERFLIIVNNRKDYKRIIHDYLLSESYEIVYKDKDFAMYR